MNDNEKQQIIDEEQLRLLSFFHYVSGAVTIAFSSMFIFHLIFFGYMISNPELFNNDDAENAKDAMQVMQIFVAVFGAFVILGITYGICEIVSGVFIKRRKYRLFSMIVAIPRIIFIPYGTILSIFTLMLLERDSIKSLYVNQGVRSLEN